MRFVKFAPTPTTYAWVEWRRGQPIFTQGAWMPKLDQMTLRKSLRIAALPAPVYAQPLRPRIVFGAEEFDELENSFASNQYPNTDQLEDLADQLALKVSQVKSWFANRRAAQRKLLQGGPQQPPTAPKRPMPMLKPRKRAREPRAAFDGGQMAALEDVFETSPNPSGATFTALEYALNIPKNKIKTWFSNRRAKKRRDFAKSFALSTSANRSASAPAPTAPAPATTPKRTRGKFSDQQRRELLASFALSQYPSAAVSAGLAASTRLSVLQVKTFFNNRRAEWRKANPGRVPP